MNEYLKKNNWFNRNIKFIFLVIYAIIFISLSVFIIYKGLDIIKYRQVKYVSNSNVDYKVYLKENDYFDKDYLEKGEKYIASLIKNININYLYTLNSDEYLSGTYNYKIVGTINVYEQGKDDVLWTHDYDLSEEKKLNFDNQNTINISQDVDIDYDYYNDLASQFKKDYGVLVDAYLQVKLVVDINLENQNNYTINGTPYVNIPLSEKTIDISISTVENNVDEQTITYTKYPMLNYILLGLGTLFLTIYIIIGIYGFIKMIKSLLNRNKYYSYLSKIFNNYDSIIVNTTKLPDLKKKDVLDVSNFEELVDANNEIHKPIIFKETKVGKESIFVLMDDTRCYRYIVKEKDFK